MLSVGADARLWCHDRAEAESYGSGRRQRHVRDVEERKRIGSRSPRIRKEAEETHNRTCRWRPIKTVGRRTGRPPSRFSEDRVLAVHCSSRAVCAHMHILCALCGHLSRMLYYGCLDALWKRRLLRMEDV